VKKEVTIYGLISMFMSLFFLSERTRFWKLQAARKIVRSRISDG